MSKAERFVDVGFFLILCNHTFFVASFFYFKSTIWFAGYSLLTLCITSYIAMRTGFALCWSRHDKLNL